MRYSLLNEGTDVFWEVLYYGYFQFIIQHFTILLERFWE